MLVSAPHNMAELINIERHHKYIIKNRLCGAVGQYLRINMPDKNQESLWLSKLIYEKNVVVPFK